MCPAKKRRTSDNRAPPNPSGTLKEIPLLLAPASLSALMGIGGILGEHRTGGLGMAVYVGPCFQGQELSRGSAFLTLSSTKGM